MTKGEDTRAEIVERATQLASVHGLEGVSIGAVADALSMSKSGVFAHFRSKEALDLAVLEHARGRFVDGVLAPAFRARRGLPRLEALADRLAAWLASDWSPGGCPIIAAGFELDDRPGRTRDAVAAIQRDLLETLAQAARIAVEEGHLRRDLDCDELAFELHGFMLAAHQAQRLRRDPRAFERFRTAVRRALDAARAPD